MPLYPSFWRSFKKMVAIFKVGLIRLIWENIRHRIITLVSTLYNLWDTYFADSALLRAPHNCGHNFARCCGYLFWILLDITYIKRCRICKCIFTLNKHWEWDQRVHPFNLYYYQLSEFHFRLRHDIVLTWRMDILIWYLPQSSTNKSRHICTGPCMSMWLSHTCRLPKNIWFNHGATIIYTLWAKTINVFRACLGAQLTICAQKWRNFVLFSTVSLRFVLSRVCVFRYSLGPLLASGR